MEINKPWVVINNQDTISMSNLDYLNYLLNKSQRAIENHDISCMVYTKYDFEEIVQRNSIFYTLYKLQIDSEIRSLERLLGNGIITYSRYQDHNRFNSVQFKIFNLKQGLVIFKSK